MNAVADFLVEIQTEELPPKSLLNLAKAFHAEITTRLVNANMTFSESQFFATPRRLAVYIKDLIAAQPEQVIERRGPQRSVAFQADGTPSKACQGFARSLGVAPSALMVIKTDQGEWVGFKQTVPGKSVSVLMPELVEQAIVALPIAKRMRWGDGVVSFVRPVHGVVLLYGNDIIPATILGCTTSRITRGHRFLAPEPISLDSASQYAALLNQNGYVVADFNERREQIKREASVCVSSKLAKQGDVLISNEALLNEVTGLVEWPVALCGTFDAQFLQLPKEVLISSMQDHQRYFPVVDQAGELLPYFVTMSNIPPHPDFPQRIVQGNERVLRARLADAAFFFTEDKKTRLDERVALLKQIVFQAKLGSLHDKTLRLQQLSKALIEAGAQSQVALQATVQRAAYLAKADLTTQMVGEFPELQGVMGYYCALYDNEMIDVAIAIKEHYWPRFAGDNLPTLAGGQWLAITDRLDTVVGAFAVNQIPTGDKDPYGLRRAALGLLRIAIECRLSVDLKVMIAVALDLYRAQGVSIANTETVDQVWRFMQERLRAWYADQGVSADVFAAVAALPLADPLDIAERIQAVQSFKAVSEAEALSVANKRVSNLLSKQLDLGEDRTIDPQLFEHAAERVLAEQLAAERQIVQRLCAVRDYRGVLMTLAKLRQPIDDFFDQVMVMTDDLARQRNRLLLLSELRALFLQVADIALLQMSA